MCKSSINLYLRQILDYEVAMTERKSISFKYTSQLFVGPIGINAVGLGKDS